VAAYYNDRVKQTVTARMHTDVGSQQQSLQDPYYLTYENKGYGASRGIEVSLEKPMGKPWTYRLSYSFARTSMGSYGTIDIYSEESELTGIVERRNANDFIISGDRTHSMRALATYHVPVEGIKQWLGFNPLKSLSVSLIYFAQSGSPYTYVCSFEELQNISNNRRYPLETRTDMNITAKIPAGAFNLVTAVRIDNLFNNRWLTPMISADDNAKWTEYGITYDTKPFGNPSSEAYREQEDNYKFSYFRTYRNTPTAVYLTVGINF
jgi:hypothetical protein